MNFDNLQLKKPSVFHLCPSVAKKICFSSVALFALWGGAQVTYTRNFQRVASLDPTDASSTYAASAIMIAYETLLEYDYAARPYKLIPGVAEALPEYQEGGRVLIFKIRPDTRFHPDPCFGVDEKGVPRGRPVTAEDFVYSLKRLADRKNTSSGAWVVEDTILGMRAFAERSAGKEPTDYDREVAGLRALDERTLRIELTAPLHIFLYYLTMPYTVAVPREAVEFYGRHGFGQRAVGTGDFALTHWRRNYRMEFVRKMRNEELGMRNAASILSLISHSSFLIPHLNFVPAQKCKRDLLHRFAAATVSVGVALSLDLPHALFQSRIE